MEINSKQFLTFVLQFIPEDYGRTEHKRRTEPQEGDVCIDCGGCNSCRSDGHHHTRTTAARSGKRSDTKGLQKGKSVQSEGGS